jgi:hypothetical protein
MPGEHEGCAVCGGRASQGARMSRVVIEGRSLELCRTHAATVVAAMPETFDDLRALFVGVGIDLGARGAAERRSPLDRRDPEDRRVFPPRPEGRRRASGRRAGEPLR